MSSTCSHLPQMPLAQSHYTGCYARENAHSVGVYFNDPDGNGLEVYYEEPGGYRGSWEGQYTRKLEEVIA